MELRVEGNKVICGLNLILQLSFLLPGVLLLRENPPSTAASSTIQFWVTASATLGTPLNLNPSERQLLCGQRLRSRRIASFDQLLPRKP